MRKKNQKQMPLMPSDIQQPWAKELDRISKILDSIPTITDMVLQDLTHGVKNRDCGAQGMTAEQVLRAAIIKQTEGFSYEELAFHLIDSRTYRNFCRIGITHKGFKKSTLCKNIKSISPETWESINRLLVAYGDDKKIEKGKEARVDCTVVCSNIHDPLDSSLLWDSVRVLTRSLKRMKEELGINISFTDHCRRAKRRLLGIMNAKNEKIRGKRYKDLLKVTEKTVSYSKTAARVLDSHAFADVAKMTLSISIAEDFKRLIPLAEQVIDQTTRRVIHGEQVSSAEKIVSIFEPHTDIIRKDRRETFYGHKVCITGGRSNLISDCLIVEGNPADSTLTCEMLDRHKQIYGHYPLKVALDGGFASKDNLEAAKSREIKDVCFAKKRGLKEEDMCRSHWVYRKLRRFRAGIESGISWLKRCFGFSRCTWKSFRSFKSYVWACIVSANLFTLARSENSAT
ncbi:MAG TPA: ISNCY family transposase [Deltaproteobacteria bacterium]|nr:ISNCY family transposase [Deltaproteobacteria bacterium]